MRYRFLAISFMLASALTLTGQNTNTPCACCTEEYKDFDFWIGDWVVYTNGQMVGFNKITKIEGDCVIRENWKSVVSSHTGTSYNFYDKVEKKWRHIYIGNDGITVDIKGEYKDQKMIMIGEPVKDDKGNRIINKVTWYNNPDGTIRQVWEQSRDGGEAYVVQWEGIYRKRKLP
jgi:hypothetical protein